MGDEKIYLAHQKLVRPGGTLIMVAAPDVSIPMHIDMKHLIEKNVKIAGSIVGSSKEIEEMFVFCHNFGVKPVV